MRREREPRPVPAERTNAGRIAPERESLQGRVIYEREWLDPGFAKKTEGRE